jgi:hypothetical protein
MYSSMFFLSFVMSAALAQPLVDRPVLHADDAEQPTSNQSHWLASATGNPAREPPVNDNEFHVPARDRLNERVRILHEAFVLSDYRTQYELHAPYLRRGLSYKDYRKDRGIEEGEGQPIGKRLESADIGEIRHCGEYNHPAVSTPLYRCVFVVHFVYSDDAGIQTYDLPQMWEFHSGEWYFGMLLHF